MLFVIEKHEGNGKFGPKREAEGTGDKAIVEVFDALDITEHADYRVRPKDWGGAAAFYRLELDGSIAEIDWPAP